MTARRPPLRTVPVVVLSLLLASVVAVFAWQPWSTKTAPVTAGSEVVADGPAPTPLTLGPDPRVLVFGDSWTYGSAATVPTDGYAYVLGRLLDGDVTVAGVRGSGYLKPGLDGPAYGERIAALDPDLDPELVIVQGSINDRREGASGYREAVEAAWDQMSARFPAAQIVILGPAPQVLPVEKATARIDRDLAALAAARGWWYVSPIAEQWITPADYAAIIDTGVGRNHPSTAGHAVLAARLAAALQERAAPTVATGVDEPTG